MKIFLIVAVVGLAAFGVWRVVAPEKTENPEASSRVSPTSTVVSDDLDTELDDIQRELDELDEAFGDELDALESEGQ